MQFNPFAGPLEYIYELSGELYSNNCNKMAIHHLLLKDYDNKAYFRMLNLRDQIEQLVSENVIAINKTGRHIQINYLDTIDTTNYIDKEVGWKYDDGLYEKLINEYNAKHTPILQRWKRHDES